MNFEKSEILIKEVEAYILNSKHSPNFLMSGIKRHLLYPWKSLKLSFSEGSNDLAKWGIISLTLILLSRITIHKFFAKSNIAFDDAFADNAIFIISILLTVFATPSTYVNSGVNATKVKFVTNLLQKEQLDSIEQLDILQKNIIEFEARANKRIVAIKWGLASLWGGLLFLYSKTIDLTIQNTYQFSVYDFLFHSIYMIIIFSLCILVLGYEKTTSMIFKTINFGINESQHNIITTNKT